MKPQISWRKEAYFILGLALCWLLLGLALESMAGLVLGALLALALPLLYLRAVLDLERLRLAESPMAFLKPQGEGKNTLVLQEGREEELLLRLPKGLIFQEKNLKTHASLGLQCRLSFGKRPSLRLEAQRLGPLFFYGMSGTVHRPMGLFELSFHSPLFRHWRVQPKKVRSLRRPYSKALNFELSQALSSIRAEKTDMELKELRPFLVGDSFRHLAWTASARRGELITREMESEELPKATLLLDLSEDLQHGMPGERAVDRILEEAFHLSRFLLDGGLELGLAAFQEDMLFGLPPSLGALHQRELEKKIYESSMLLEFAQAPKGSYALDQKLSQFLFFQHEKEWLKRLGGIEPFLERDLFHSKLLLWVEELLEETEEPGPLRRKSMGNMEESLSVFCRQHGIQLETAIPQAIEKKGEGLKRVLSWAFAQNGAGQSLFLLTDFQLPYDEAFLAWLRSALATYQSQLYVFYPKKDPDAEISLGSESESAMKLLESIQRKDTMQKMMRSLRGSHGKLIPF